MAQLASRRLWQLLHMRSTLTTVSSVPKSNGSTTAHAVPLLKAGCDLESPDSIYGSRSWKWLRPATPVEIDLDDWNQYKTRMGIPCLTISADREISEDVWRQMIKHTNNQMPCLRMVILPRHNRNNEKWICQVNDMNISLKMYENKTPLDIVDDILDEFVETSPWVCVVIKASEDDACPLPEEKKSKPYQYYLAFTSHHGILDGYSGALMIRYAINNLNVLLAGRNVDDRIQLCEPRKVDEIISKKVKLKEAFRNNPKWFQKEKSRLLATLKPPLLNEAFPAPNVSNPKTATLVRTADAVILSAFQRHCKSAGLSITNGLTAIINTAQVEMVRDAGILRDSYHLTLNTNVDLRRYMKVHPQTATGMLVGGMHMSMHPSKNVRKEFWEHAKMIHDDAKTLLKTDGALIESVIRELAVPSVDPDVVFNSSSGITLQRDYTMNNLKDLTPIFYDPKRHKHAVITAALLLTTLHNFNPMMFSLNSYRGLAQFTLDWGTNFISDEIAEELMERIVLLIRDKVQINM